MSGPVEIATTERADVGANADEPKLMDHSYDGIHEYDNPLPGWWSATFWATIVFAAGYWVWFHVTPWHSTPDGQYRQSLVGYNETKELRAAREAANVSETSLAQEVQNPESVAKGAKIFATRCASCHTEDGHGLIGPNLTDNFQIHGSTRMDIFNTISNGVQGTAMPAWGEQMAPTDILAVASFVIPLRGKNIPGKAPDGHPVEAFKR
jgi:cytochrome c oxidase cbb3-type subunit 3